MTAHDWWPDELAHAGTEHLDPSYVEGYDAKAQTDWADDVERLLALGIGPESTVVDLGAGTGTFAQAIRPYVGEVVAVDVSPAMVEHMRANGVEAVRAGLLTYDGPPVDAVVSRNVLHHLPDFWKAIALDRVARMLRPGGIFLLRDIVYAFEPSEIDRIDAWLAGAPDDPAQGWTRAQLAGHVRDEHSTFTWLLEPILEHAGFEIRDRWTSEGGIYASYWCIRCSPA
jgi:SAM-dependent methyltransferase